MAVAAATALPVATVLADVRTALAANRPVALVAPPGAGKTTAVPPVLLDDAWARDGQIILLQPRRVAARAAAERIAAMRGEAVGETIGYSTRMDRRSSPATRLLVVTDGVFTRQIVAAPDLPGVAGVIFDEVHERSLESDLGLALALESRSALRPDLRLMLMSATLDVAGFAGIIPDLVQLESAGRTYPVELRHIGRNPAERLETAMAAAIRTALANEPGSVLAFLPGLADIERTAREVADRLPADVDLHRLHGQLAGTEQRAAIAPAPSGRRKLVLATSIAETSITIDGVRVVIDCGLARRPRRDGPQGLTRLETVRASQAAIAQRAGRAGRTAPGLAIRLWEAAENLGRPAFDPPEIMDADLAGLVLDCARWGVTDPAVLPWRDRPPALALAQARDRLQRLGAVDGDGRVTAHGERMAGLPLPPEQAHMLILAAARGHGLLAARIAMLMGERGLGGAGDDLEQRLAAWQRDGSPRAANAARLAARWAQAAGARETTVAIEAAGVVLALALPDRVARRRGNGWLMAGGRAVNVSDTSALARQEWIVVADAAGQAAGARVLLGASLHADVEQLLADRIETRAILAFDPATTGVTFERQRRLGAIIVSRQTDARPDPAHVRGVLLDAVRSSGLALLPWGDAAGNTRARLAFAAAHGLALPASDDAALADSLDEWLAPILGRRLADIGDGAMADALLGRLDWSQRHALDRFAPARLETPAGSSHAIDYGADGGPAVDVRCQALFGLVHHPMLADGRVPLTLRLTSPAGRPIQVTRDLPGFWAGSWADVRKELKGRYPKHPWPENPATAPPTLRARRPG